MDARLEAAGIGDIVPPPMYIIRNAGGRVTSDTLRSLAIACTMGVEQILVVHHTQCAMTDNTEDDIYRRLPPGVEPTIDFLTIADPVKALQQDLMAVKDCQLLPHTVQVLGHIYAISPDYSYNSESDREDVWLQLL